MKRAIPVYMTICSVIGDGVFPAIMIGSPLLFPGNVIYLIACTFCIIPMFSLVVFVCLGVKWFIPVSVIKYCTVIAAWLLPGFQFVAIIMSIVPVTMIMTTNGMKHYKKKWENDRITRGSE